jgi:hypothetical protein
MTDQYEDLPRRQISVSATSREVWREAWFAAHEDGTSLSDLTARALREYLARRRKRLGKLDIPA